MPKKTHKKFIIAGLIIFAVGLALSSGLIICFGIGMVVSNALFNDGRSKHKATGKSRMTDEENNQLISVTLPVVTNNK